LNGLAHKLVEVRKGGGEMKKKTMRKSDDPNVEEKKMKEITEEKTKAEDPQKITLPGPPYFTGKRKHS
jgi:hypothetical protein